MVRALLANLLDRSCCCLQIGVSLRNIKWLFPSFFLDNSWRFQHIIQIIFYILNKLGIFSHYFPFFSFGLCIKLQKVPLRRKNSPELRTQIHNGKKMNEDKVCFVVFHCDNSGDLRTRSMFFRWSRFPRAPPTGVSITKIFVIDLNCLLAHFFVSFTEYS